MRTEGRGGLELGPRELLAAARRNALSIVLCVLGCLFLSGVVTLFLTPRFSATARVFIEDPSGAGALTASALPAGLAGIVGSAPRTAAEIQYLRSRPVVSAVVEPPDPTGFAPDAGLDLLVRTDDLDLQDLWRIARRRLFGLAEPSGSLEVEVVRWEFPPDFASPLRLHFSSSSEVEVWIDRWFSKGRRTIPFRAGEPLEYGGATLVLRPVGDLTGRNFRVRRGSLQKTVEDFVDNLQVKEVERGSNVLTISFPDTDPVRSADVVNALVRSYSAHNRQRRARGASRGADFLQEEVERVRGELSEAEADLVAFGERVGPLALAESLTVLLERLATLDLERARVELAARSAELLLTEVRSGELGLEEIAGLEVFTLGEGVPFGEAIEPLSALLARRAALGAVYEDAWPEVRALDLEIEGRRSSIESVLEAEVRSQQALARDLGEIAERYVAEMGDVPEAQVELVRYKRRVEAFTQIYLFLVSQREEAKIGEATAVPNIDVMEWALPPRRRESPRFSIAAIVGGVLGLFLAAGFALVRERTRPVSSAEHAAATVGARVLARLPRSKELGANLFAVRDRPDGEAAESFRELRSVLQPLLAEGGARTLAVASTRAGEGRTSVAVSLAESFARAGARVVLVDAAVLRPRLEGDRVTLAALLDGAEPPRPQPRRVGVVPLGDAGAELADRLADPAAGAMLEGLADGADLVVFDLPSCDESAVASVLAGRVDATLVVCRREGVGEAALAGAAGRMRAAGASILGVVLRT